MTRRPDPLFPAGTWRRRVGAFLAGWLAAFAVRAAEPPPVAAGASVDETLVQQTLYVDPGNAEAADDDKHGGSADAPLATLRYACQAAERLKDAGKGVKLILAAGTYRESIEIHPPANGKPDTDAPLVIEAAERDQTVIDGADAEGWTASTWKDEGGKWTHPWPFKPRSPLAGVPPPPIAPPGPVGEVYQPGYLLIVNGTPLRQVAGLADLAPGTFWVPPSAAPPSRRRGAPPPPPAPGEENGALVIVQPPEETPLEGAIIQLGARPVGLAVTGRRNVVVRGLMIQHVAAPTGAPAEAVGVRFTDCANVLVEDVLSQWNDGVGLVVSGHGAACRDWTLRRVRILHNGDTGLLVSGAGNVLVEDTEASFNDYRGEWAGWTDPARPAGVRVRSVAGSTWRRQRAVGNACRGLWFTDCANLTVEEAVLRDNRISGLRVDGGAGPTLFRRGLITGTKPPLDPPLPEGVGEPAAVSFHAERVTFESNVVAANAVPALGLSTGLPGGAPLGKRTGRTAAPTALRVAEHTIQRNVFYGQDAGQLLGSWPAADRIGTGDFSGYYGTLILQDNCFWNPASPDVFVTFDKNGPRRPPLSFDAWMAFLASRTGGGGKTPLNSVWADPLFVNAPEGDFRLQDASPVKDWELLVDENSAGQ